MAKILRVYDPSVTIRRVPLVIQDASCPGLVEFLSKLAYGTETPLIRGVLYQWFLAHQAAGTLDQAAAEVLDGPGGRTSSRPGGKTRSTRPVEAQTIPPTLPPAVGVRPAPPVLPPAEPVQHTHESPTERVEPVLVIQGMELTPADIQALNNVDTMFG
ncbi:MAG TPA: hypothetical protein VJ698_03665 [Noviherbaspirillum sp.]|uniref:hypothetical protein n=1 Tax=Noviherbaspirillum sp. TaxID=1926288 RepID=UPI002B494CB5|nr:hypothetical protein [Noviherbaspirillum sp.]HJV84548.1 hypothetical protein [Noviherbaspirillum sp.]